MISNVWFFVYESVFVQTKSSLSTNYVQHISSWKASSYLAGQVTAPS